jgi:hypothetical protein
MADYVQLGATKTWYDDHGSGDPVVCCTAVWWTRGPSTRT